MKDPLVNEVRQSRHEHAHQFHDDLAAICENLRDIQRTCEQAVVTFPPKRVSTSSHRRNTSETVGQVAA